MEYIGLEVVERLALDDGQEDVLVPLNISYNSYHNLTNHTLSSATTITSLFTMKELVELCDTLFERSPTADSQQKSE